MTTPASPDGGSGTPAPQNGWGEPPRYGQYAPESDAGGPASAQSVPQYGQGQYGQAQYGQRGAGPGGGPPFGSSLPPVADKPGIVPLRPLSLGEIYDGAFQAVRHNPGVVLGFTTIVLAVAAAIGAVLSLPLTTIFADLWGDFADLAASDPTANPEDLAVIEQMNGLIPGFYGVGLGSVITLSLATPLAVGGVALAVSESVLDRKVTMGQAWRRVAPRWWFLLAVGLLLGLVTLLFTALVVAAVVGMFAVDTGFGVVGIFLAAIGFVVFSVWLTIRTLLIAPSLVLERQGFWTTMGRGWRLTRGVFWRMLGIYLLTYLILWFLGQIVGAPLQVGVGFASVTADPVLAQVGLAITTLAVALLETVFMGAVVALLYIDTRMRREGLDVQLAAAAADR
ncbi:glycerophosphoryl diester phosphodiesterase membrane domain-containing protein [Myceligenerans cantabricum]